MTWFAIALAVAATICCAVLFIALKKGMAAATARHGVEYRRLETTVAEVRASLEQLRQTVEDSRQQAAAAARPLAGMNLTSRGQALRMLRRGERPEQIAAALSLPLSEVELLIKVHRLNQTGRE